MCLKYYSILNIAKNILFFIIKLIIFKINETIGNFEKKMLNSIARLSITYNYASGVVRLTIIYHLIRL